jgi:hypothetical protein
MTFARACPSKLWFRVRAFAACRCAVKDEALALLDAEAVRALAPPSVQGAPGG